MTNIISVTRLTNVMRPKGDPKVIETGPGSLHAEDRLAKSLGWFSVALGAAEVFAAGRFTRALGMQGSEHVFRAFGTREIASGLLSLSVDKKAGLWSRVAGDGLDIAMLMRALTPGNPQRRNVKRALMAVAGVAALDILAAWTVSQRQRRRSPPRDFSDRSGYPRGMPMRTKPLAKETRFTREAKQHV